MKLMLTRSDLVSAIAARVRCTPQSVQLCDAIQALGDLQPLAFAPAPEVPSTGRPRGSNGTQTPADTDAPKRRKPKIEQQQIFEPPLGGQTFADIAQKHTEDAVAAATEQRHFAEPAVSDEAPNYHESQDRQLQAEVLPGIVAAAGI